MGLSLARASDVDAVPALVEHEATGSPWADVQRWAAAVSTSDAAERIALLSLPGGPIPQALPPARRAAVEATAGRERRTGTKAPLVVDLSSLWAGPLCGDLLARTGARVIKVESRARPDGARSGSRTFFDRMNGRKELCRFDFGDDGDISRLRALLDEADVVIEASRPRALRALGIDAHAAAERGAVWVSLTAYGRSGADGMRVGFGDDVAASAGLARWGSDGPYPVGDALADPLTGVVAAHATVQALDSGHGALLDVSMYDVAVWARRLGAALPEFSR
ncbi:MAG: CoA transferase [Microbacterium sp.]